MQCFGSYSWRNVEYVIFHWVICMAGALNWMGRFSTISPPVFQQETTCDFQLTLLYILSLQERGLYQERLSFLRRSLLKWGWKTLLAIAWPAWISISFKGNSKSYDQTVGAMPCQKIYFSPFFILSPFFPDFRNSCSRQYGMEYQQRIWSEKSYYLWNVQVSSIVLPLLLC